MMKDYGFTLVELMVVVLILLIIIAGIFGVLNVGRQSWYTGGTQVELRQETRKAMDRMVKELRQSETAVISVPADDSWYNTITFQVPEDTDGDGDVIDADSNIEWGNQITYSLGGLNNEQVLRTSSGSTAVLANDVVSLQFRRSTATPNIVEISLQAQKDAMPGRTMQADLNSQVSLRNY